jgi:serine/threonine-protein phosphatase 5
MLSDQMGNKGAYINIRKKNKEDDSERPELDLDYVQFFAVPHPAVKPMQYSGMYGGMFGL